MNSGLSTGRKIAAFLFLAIFAAGAFFFWNKGKKSEKEIKSLKVISTVNDMKCALEGASDTYLIDSAVLSGDAVNDPFGIFSAEMLSITSKKEVCDKRVTTTRKNGRTKTKVKYNWNSVQNDRSNVVSQNMFIYDDISFSVDGFDISYPKNISSYCKGCCLSNKNYYPGGSSSNKDGNVRYLINCIPNNSKISCVAEVGGTKVSSSVDIKSGAKLVFGGKNTLIKAYSSGFKVGMIVMIVCAVLIPLLIIIARPRQRSNF